MSIAAASRHGRRLHNTGQSGGTAGADIHAPEAWDITTITLHATPRSFASVQRSTPSEKESRTPAKQKIYSALKLMQPSYTDPTLEAGKTEMKVEHIAEIRATLIVVE